MAAHPWGLVYDPGVQAVFVTEDSSNGVSAISDANDQVASTSPVGNSPFYATYDPGRGEVLVTNLVDGSVSVVSDSGGASCFWSSWGSYLAIFVPLVLVVALAVLLHRRRARKRRASSLPAVVPSPILRGVSEATAPQPTLVRCPYCGSKYDPTQEKCPNCGAPLGS